MAEARAQEVLDYLRGRQDELLFFLERLVLAESPSADPRSQEAAFDLIGTALDELDFEVRRLPGKESGGSLYATPERRIRGRPAQLLLGHCDTVWPIGTLEEMPVAVEGDRMTGPGILDMKGGLTQMLFALRALRDLGLEPMVTPAVFVNSDEEIGSRESTPYIRLLARRVSRVFVMEPALGPTGKLKTARKAVGQFTVKVKGKAAHAGLDPGKGVSAILELSHQIQKLFDLNDLERGISVNVGCIDGGLRPNVIAPESMAIVDVRVPTAPAAVQVENAILGLQPVGEGITLEVAGGINRHPLEPTPRNRAVWAAAERKAADLGIDLDEGLAGGGSDGNTTSQFTATLDGMGSVGDGAHAQHEHVVIPRMIERSALLALLLLESPLEPIIDDHF